MAERQHDARVTSIQKLRSGVSFLSHLLQKR